MELALPLGLALMAGASADAEETELVAGSLAGDEAAFAELVRRHQTRVFRLAGRFFRRREDVEDVAQDTFVTAWRKLGTYAARAPFEHWITRVCLRLCYARLGAERRREPAIGSPDMVAAPADVVTAIDIERLLAKLAPADRFVLLLLEGDGRVGINPGPNVLFGDADDVRGSFGVRHADVTGNPVLDAIFGFNVQVTGRSAPTEDPGRQNATGSFADRGQFKVPTLRGVGLKTTYMHNGVFNNLPDVVAHYRPGNPAIFLDNIDPILPVAVPPNVGPALIDFMANALTDPRVAAQTFPFDQPALHAGGLPQLSFDADKSTLHWPALQGVPAYVMYRGELDDLVDANTDGVADFGYGVCVTGSDPNPADTVFVDAEMPAAGQGFFYVKGVRDGASIRGLGVTSGVKPRLPAVECP